MMMIFLLMLAKFGGTTPVSSKYNAVIVRYLQNACLVYTLF